MTEKNNPAPNSIKRNFLGFARKLALGCGAIYLTIILFLVLSETSLVYPGAHGESNWEPSFPYEEVWVDSTNDARVHGWYLPLKDAQRFVLLHHGNGENVAQVAERYALAVGKALNANVLVYDYRGFGKSEGTPDETAVIDDGEAMLEWLLQRAQLENAQQGVFYFGSSLGGGVAVGLAERHPPAYLILDRTFDAITTAGAERYPWVPVKLLMKNRFNSVDRIRSIDSPLFQSHFTEDELCTLKSAKLLFESAKTTDKHFLELPGGGHYEPLPDEYWVKLKAFFDAKFPSQARSGSVLDAPEGTSDQEPTQQADSNTDL